MDTDEFRQKLLEAQNLMSKENYKEALVILGKLKEIDKARDIDYNLAHKMYQLLSNSHSLYNQQIILKNIEELSKNIEGISLSSLNQMLKDKDQLDLTEDILLREIELLILRGLLKAKLDKGEIFF